MTLRPKIGLGTIHRSGGSSLISEKSLMIDGLSELVNIDSSLNALGTTTSGTFLIWMYIVDATPTANNSIVTFGSTSSGLRLRAFVHTSGDIYFEMRDTGSVIQWRIKTNAQALVDNTWHLIGLTSDGVATQEIFVDDVKPAQSYLTTTDKTQWFNNEPTFDVGRLGTSELNSNPASQFLNGGFDQVTFVDRALTLLEFQDVYSRGIPKDETAIANGLTSYSFGDNSGDNYNVGVVGEWVFKDGIGSNDAQTLNCEESDVVENVPYNFIDSNTVFANSINYSIEVGYNKRPTNALFGFNTTSINMSVKAVSTGGRNNIGLYVDGVFNQELTTVDGVWTNAILPAGSKLVELIEQRVGTSSLDGCRITDLQTEPVLYSRTNPTNVSERIVVISDSIGNGSSSSNQYSTGYMQQFKFTDSRNVTVLAFGGAKLQDYAGTAGDRATTVGWITDAFSDTTTTKKLVVALSTNDHEVATAATSIGSWYESLLDDINAADSDIIIYGFSPLTKSTEDALLDDYRTEISDACTARAYATYIDGKTILTYPADFADLIHPNDTGHTKIHDAIEGTIL